MIKTGRSTGCSAVMTIALLQLFLVMAAQAEAPWPDPERFRAAIHAFESEDRKTPPPSGAIVGTGSSSMRFWSVGDRFASDLSPLTVINRGFGGSVMHDVETFLEPLVLKHQPRAVLIYEGDNDVAEGVRSTTFLLRMIAFKRGLTNCRHRPGSIGWRLSLVSRAGRFGRKCRRLTTG